MGRDLQLLLTWPKGFAWNDGEGKVILATIYDGSNTEQAKLKIPAGARVNAYQAYDIEPQALVFDVRYTRLDES